MLVLPKHPVDMSLPFDDDIFVNVLRETCLAAAIQLKEAFHPDTANTNATITTTTSSMFGTLYNPVQISSRLDVDMDRMFPMLSKVQGTSPPIRFEEESVKNKKNGEDTTSNDNGLVNNNINIKTNANGNDPALSKRENVFRNRIMQSKRQPSRLISGRLRLPTSSQIVEDQTNITDESDDPNTDDDDDNDKDNFKFNHRRILSNISIKDTSSMISKNSGPFIRQRTNLPLALTLTPSKPEDNPTGVGVVTDRTEPFQHPPRNSTSITVSESTSSYSDNHAKSATQSATASAPAIAAASVTSLPAKSGKATLLSPTMSISSVITTTTSPTDGTSRPSMGSRSISLNTILSFNKDKNKSDASADHEDHTMSDSGANVGNINIKANSGANTSTKKPGFLSLGRLIHPKQIASTLVHHSNSNSGTGTNDSITTDNMGLTMGTTDVNGPVHREQSPLSQTQTGLDGTSTVNQSFDSGKYITSSNSERDTIDSSLEDEENDALSDDDYDDDDDDDQDVDDSYILGNSLDDEKRKAQLLNIISDSEDDDEDDDYDDDDDEDGDGDEEESVVDSIESSVLADSDYDYFNPPAGSSRSGARLRGKSVMSNNTRFEGNNDNFHDDFDDDDDDEYLRESRLRVGSFKPGSRYPSNSIPKSATSHQIGSGSGSGRRRRNLAALSGHEGSEYTDIMESDECMSDTEDYRLNDTSAGYYGNTVGADDGSTARKLSTSVSISDLDSLSDKALSVDGRLKRIDEGETGTEEHRANTISNISFVKSRHNTISNGNGRRKSMESGTRPRTLTMTDTGGSNKSIDNTSLATNLGTHVLSKSVSSRRDARKSNKASYKSVKSYNNLSSVGQRDADYMFTDSKRVSSGGREKSREKGTEKKRDTLEFKKVEIPASKSSAGVGSKLTELIHKKDISLEYYKYVGEKQSESDKLIDATVYIPDLGIGVTDPCHFKINTSVQVVEAIGYALYMIYLDRGTSDNDARKEFQKKLSNANYWKMYLADEDGEAEDDFGMLDRTRNIDSYGADEFVIVQCDDREFKSNEKITPSPLEQDKSSTGQPSLAGGSNAASGENMNSAMDDSLKRFDLDGSEATLPSELTPMSDGLNYHGTLANGTLVNNAIVGKMSRRQKASTVRVQNDKRLVFDNLNSDDDDDNDDYDDDDYRKSAGMDRYDQNKFRKYLNAKVIDGAGHKDRERDKESKLNKFKTKSKTIQSILHNTADHYQLTQQELFRSGLSGSLARGGGFSRSSDNEGTRLGGLGLGKSIGKGKYHGSSDPRRDSGVFSAVNGTNGGYVSEGQARNNLLNAGDGDGEDDANKALMYHRWTVWRRQQMSFKNKLPKTLTVDGYQIYLLPFNEFEGSWYESKTYNFDISQILKVKQNPKVPNNFKVIIKKNADGIVKKYYLEAQNAKECRDIVNTIRALAKTYSEQM